MDRNRLLALLFPPKPREFPCRRGIRTLLRAFHILTSGTLVGGHIFAQPDTVLMPWLAGGVLSGFLLLAADLHASFAFLVEARGVAVIAKLLLLCSVPFHPDMAVPLLVTIVLFGAVSSHLPRDVRHRVLFTRHRALTERDGRK